MRTDIHRPSAIVPSEYEFVTMDYIGPSEAYLDFAWERKAYREHMKLTGGKEATHEHGGTCGTCGATAFYVGRFYHAKTNTYLTVGHECAGKFGLGDEIAFRNFKKAVAARRKVAKRAAKAVEILTAAGLMAAWDVYTAEDKTGWKYEETTIADIVGKLAKYGSVSDKALNFVRALLAKIPERADREAKWAAEKAAAAPAPVTDARVTITGKVLSTKVKDTRFGRVLKMLVKTDAGWTTWGTVPSRLDVERGDRITFDAYITVSENDNKFSFFSRPSKAVNLTARDERAAEDAADRKLDFDAVVHGDA